MEKLNGFEEWGTNWEIKLKSSVTIGGLCFKCKPDNEGSVEIGYGINEDYQHHGYATEVVKGITEWALKQNGVKCVCAQTNEENVISKKVLTGNGFVYEGHGDEGILFKKIL
ncbi:GNAT family N-acetyltransferase [Anaerofustis stercorihominis]|uniref:GNAT family N-acetyltransferase n=1 Tax=Anaerofustis stercorihominis TaxID=214853 RepID=UPI00214B8C8A|nr:GNAT family N-acetyltransferase [Anaerofustis stercorihominis]MCR2032757.1 GNAT family N-acetyltransferase [Anaerofustis stercorihominis]